MISSRLSLSRWGLSQHAERKGTIILVLPPTAALHQPRMLLGLLSNPWIEAADALSLRSSPGENYKVLTFSLPELSLFFSPQVRTATDHHNHHQNLLDWDLLIIFSVATHLTLSPLGHGDDSLQERIIPVLGDLPALFKVSEICRQCSPQKHLN